SRRFSKGYFGFDILGAIPFHRPTKWGQYIIIDEIGYLPFGQWDQTFAGDAAATPMRSASFRVSLRNSGECWLRVFLLVDTVFVM
ncbi:hypothetical protein P2S22_23765, partial [Escherichia coli]